MFQSTAFKILLVGVVLVSASLSVAARGWRTEFGESKTDLVPTGRNPYFILEPGYQLVLEGQDDGRSIQLVITVLDETKAVDGVETRIVEERESADGELEEVSRNYFAISKNTTSVYYLGEETTLYDDGVARKGPDSWEAGVNGARIGLIMPGEPRVKMKHYQEQAPGTAMDRAEVVSINESAVVPAGKFGRCLRVRETNPLEGNEKEYKLYAPGVGLIVDAGLQLVRYGPSAEPKPKG